MSKYVERVIEDVKTKYANEPEFCQTVHIRSMRRLPFLREW